MTNRKGQEVPLPIAKSVPASVQSPSLDENRVDLLGFQDPEAQEAHASLRVKSWKETGY